MQIIMLMSKHLPPDSGLSIQAVGQGGPPLTGLSIRGPQMYNLASASPVGPACLDSIKQCAAVLSLAVMLGWLLHKPG